MMASNQELINFIRECRRQEIPYEEIKISLRERGWSGNDINEAFSRATNSQITKPQKPEKKKFLISIIVIVIVSLLIVSGGILAYQYWWLPKQEESAIEPSATKESEEIEEAKEEAEQPEQALPEEEEEEEEEPGQPEAEQPEALQEEEIDITVWKTYQNQEYEFELKYPEDWILKEKQRDETNTIVEIYPIKGLNCKKLFGKEFCLDNIFIQVLDNQENLEIETLLSKFYQDWLPKNFQDLEIAGRQGVKYDSYQPSDGSSQLNTALEADSKVIILTGNHLVVKEVQIYNQVLSNFKFIGTKAVTEIRLDVDAPSSLATLAITYQGYMTYEVFASDLGTEKQVETAEITTEQYDELANLIINNNFFSFEESYIEEGLIDATTHTLTVRRGKEAKSVSCRGQCPQEIVQIREKIKELWGKEI